MPVVNMSICSAVDSKYVSLILIRVILASDCSNEFLKKQMFPCRNGNDYEVSLTCPYTSSLVSQNVHPFIICFLKHQAPSLPRIYTCPPDRIPLVPTGRSR